MQTNPLLAKNIFEETRISKCGDPPHSCQGKRQKAKGKRQKAKGKSKKVKVKMVIASNRSYIRQKEPLVIKTGLFVGKRTFFK